jgi:hypothetical protein
LVKKHWDRLSVGSYAMLMFSQLLPTKSITPSNQLSYVARFQFEEQGLLVSGDAGCVDFSPSRGNKFYKDLLNAPLPLHVIQVAHHGGNNAKFYNVLLKAKYDEQSAESFLLLSHASNDGHRPSDIFGQFVANLRKDVDNVQILFTGVPRKKYVKDFRTLIAQRTEPRMPAGDIRLSFDGHNWKVRKHAIEVL